MKTLFSSWNIGGWAHALGVSLCVYIIAICYGYFYRQGLSSAVFSESLAFTGGVLIGLSFLLAPISYFFNFADKELRYRKFLGLIGYYYALLYACTLQLRFPERYFYGLVENLSQAEVVLGLAAMSIFTVMALVSGPIGMKVLGKGWRTVLRLGYLAYFLLCLRAVIVEGALWQQWFNSFQTLPPPRLVLTLFALFVILARGVMLARQFTSFTINKGLASKH